MRSFWNQKPLSVHSDGDLSLIQTEHGFQREDLPASLEWDVFHLDDTDKFEEWYAFLVENYKTPGFPFQIVYTRSHLRFELGSAGGHWIVALRSVKLNGRPMIACIAGDVRQLCHAFSTSMKVAPDALSNVLFIEFLCIHPSLRHLGIAPKLIHEISRLAHTSSFGIQKAYYSSATQLPEAFCCSDNYHRPIQWKRCFESGYVPESMRTSKHCQRLMALDALPNQREFQFRRWTRTVDATENMCKLINDYDAKYRKIYEPMTPERWDKMNQAECVDCIVVYNSDKRIGCISTVSHPYKMLSGTTDIRLNTVLLYRYGFDLELSSNQILRIWNALFQYALRYLPHWDAFTTIHPDVYNAMGFRKGHSYYHYMYNVHMMPLESKDISMIGI